MDSCLQGVKQYSGGCSNTKQCPRAEFEELAHQILRIEHAAGATQNGVLAGVVRMVLGGNLQNSGHGRRMGIDHMTNKLGAVLVD